MENILDFVRTLVDVDYGIMSCLKHDLESLVIIAHTEGIKEVRDALNKIWNKE